MTSVNICKTGEFKDSVFLKAHCACNDDDHTQTLIIDYDDEIGTINMCICTNAYPDYVFRDRGNSILDNVSNWLAVQKKKLEWIFSIIFKGYIEVETVFTLHGEDQVRSYVSAITEAAETIKNKKDK